MLHIDGRTYAMGRMLEVQAIHQTRNGKFGDPRAEYTARTEGLDE